VTVATYIELLQRAIPSRRSSSTLRRIRMLFSWLVTGQIVPTNPAHAVRGPGMSNEGKTPILSLEETRALFESIKPGTVVDLAGPCPDRNDVFTFARVGGRRHHES